MWRWSCLIKILSNSQIVFSTHVEVILDFTLILMNKMGILHTCGGDPLFPLFKSISFLYSPHMWRWSYTDKLVKEGKLSILHTCGGDPWNVVQNPFSCFVFSTHVEVIPTPSPVTHCPSSILHTCGGDPYYFWPPDMTALYSPHMWRWSWAVFIFWKEKTVFSTHVEVILAVAPFSNSGLRILHTCGGDPFYTFHRSNKKQYSPHMWRWSSRHWRSAFW